MEYKFKGKEIVITTSELFKGNKPVTLGADNNYHDTGWYIFAYDDNKSLKPDDVVDGDKDLFVDDNQKIGLIYNDKQLQFIEKPTLLVDTKACVNLGDDRTYTNKLLYRKYNKDEADKIQTGIYYVTLNG